MPKIVSAEYFAKAFNTVQRLVDESLLIAAHDVSAGGLITTLLEMTFANTRGGLQIDLNEFGEADTVKLLFAENNFDCVKYGGKFSEESASFYDYDVY